MRIKIIYDGNISVHGIKKYETTNIVYLKNTRKTRYYLFAKRSVLKFLTDNDETIYVACSTSYEAMSYLDCLFRDNMFDFTAVDNCFMFIEPTDKDSKMLDSISKSKYVAGDIEEEEEE